MREGESAEKILEDDREIEAIYTPDGKWLVSEGDGDCDKIVAYPEPGDGAHVPAFACYCDGKIRWRINWRHVEAVRYRGEN